MRRRRQQLSIKFEIATDADFGNELTGVITDITVTDSKITLEFDRTAIRHAGVTHGESLYLRFLPLRVLLNRVQV